MTLNSHHSAASGTDSWLTPPDMIEAMGGPESFDLDPCSIVDRPWPTAAHHYTVEDNGLLKPWWGRVWLNPPYSLMLIRRFLARMAEHNHGIALISARTETEHFFGGVWDAASGVLFLRGRLHFHVGADGWYGPKNAKVFLRKGERAPFNAGVSSVLVSYGDDDRDVLAAAPIDGYFMALRLPRSIVVTALEQSWVKALEEWFDAAGEAVPLSDLYRAFQSHPKARGNRNWRAKIRQSLQRGAFERVDQGVWKRRAA